MKQLFKYVILLVAFALHLVWFAQVRAQDPTWQEEAAERLRAIYDRNEFRASDIDPEWLPDSSGYMLREKDPETNKPVVALLRCRLRNS